MSDEWMNEQLRFQFVSWTMEASFISIYRYVSCYGEKDACSIPSKEKCLNICIQNIPAYKLSRQCRPMLQSQQQQQPHWIHSEWILTWQQLDSGQYQYTKNVASTKYMQWH